MSNTLQPQPKKLPLSPHVTIYKWRLTMLASIMHRFSGVWLALAVPIALWLILTMAHGHIGYFYGVFWMRSAWGMMLIWITCTAACYHTLNGVRFLALDLGLGESRAMMRLSAKIVIVLTILFSATLAVWL